MKKPSSFEDALERLEAIVARLEEGEVGLEESLEQYREGIRLHRYCQDKLRKVEQELMRVLKEDELEGAEQPPAEEADPAGSSPENPQQPSGPPLEANEELPF